MSLRLNKGLIIRGFEFRCKLCKGCLTVVLTWCCGFYRGRVDEGVAGCILGKGFDSALQGVCFLN